MSWVFYAKKGEVILEAWREKIQRQRASGALCLEQVHGGLYDMRLEGPR